MILLLLLHSIFVQLVAYSLLEIPKQISFCFQFRFSYIVHESRAENCYVVKSTHASNLV
jgi:hypothetical protein